MGSCTRHRHRLFNNIRHLESSPPGIGLGLCAGRQLLVDSRVSSFPAWSWDNAIVMASVRIQRLLLYD